LLSDGLKQGTPEEAAAIVTCEIVQSPTLVSKRKHHQNEQRNIRWTGRPPDAELKYTQSGKAVADFNIAVDNGKDSEGQKRQPTWVKCVLLGAQSRRARAVMSEGRHRCLQGPVSTEAWIRQARWQAQSRIIVTVPNSTFGGGAKNETERSG